MILVVTSGVSSHSNLSGSDTLGLNAPSIYIFLRPSVVSIFTHTHEQCSSTHLEREREGMVAEGQRDARISPTASVEKLLSA